MAKFLRRINYNGTNYEIADLAYAVCSTPSATLGKVVDSGNNLDFELLDGIKIVVKFENAVTMQNSTLKVGNTAAKLMKYNGAVLSSDVIKANQVCQFVYSSSEDAWIMIGGTGSGDVNLTDILIFKGVVTPSSGLPAIYEVGATYRVGTAGNIPIGTGGLTIGPCEAGDMIICVSENSSAANASASDWAIVQANLDGAVIGPVNSLNGNIAIFSGTTGKLIADGGITVGDLATAGHVHGNISNTGTMSSTGVALANGDSLVFSDSSNSGKIEKTSITFDGSTDVDALTAAGTWREFVPALIENGSVTTSLDHINDGTGNYNGFFFNVTAPNQPEGTRRSQFGVGLTETTGIGLVSTEGIYIGGITQLNGTLIPAARSSSIGTVSDPWSSIYGDLYGNAATASAAQLNTTQYGVAYYNDTAGAFAGTAAGSANQVLVSRGGTTPPSWKTLNTTTVNSTAVSYSNGILTLSSTTPTVVSSFTNEVSM